MRKNVTVCRREFLGGVLGAAGLAAVSGCAGLACGDRRLKLACQLWSVKDLWQKSGDVTSVFPQLAAMGYEGVQSAAFLDCDLDRLEKALDFSGLSVADQPVKFEQVESPAALAKTVAFCRRFGVSFVYIPWTRPATLAGWREFASKLDDIGRRLAPEGIRIGYHHHLHEFHDRVEGAYPADVLMAHPGFAFELDVGPILEAGRDPAAVMRSLPGRVPGIHAKPYPGTFAGAPDDRQDWPAIVAAARAIGTRWLVVECEQRKDTFDDVRASAAYFRGLDGALV